MPSRVSAIELVDAAAIATALFKPLGTVVWLPQLTTAPLLRNARLKPLPAAMATAFVTLAGALVSPAVLSPQPATVPVSRRARLWVEPPATAVMFVSPAGTLLWE